MSVKHLGAAMLLGALVCPAVGSATGADDLCSPAADPCTLDASVTVSSGSLLDFAPRRFQMTGRGRLRIGFGDTLTIRARAITLQPGALIDHVAGAGSGARLVIEALDDIQLQRSGVARARVSLPAPQGGGTIALTAGRAVLVDGDLVAAGTTLGADGGTVRVLAGGDATLGGDVRLSGGRGDGVGGDLRVQAGGAVVANGAVIEASGGFEGGDVTLIAGLGLSSSATINVNGTAPGTDAGSVTLTADGDVRLQGPILGSGRGSIDFGGLGAGVTITAGGSVRIEAPMTLTGGLPDGDGGVVDVSAGVDIVQTAAIMAHAVGSEGSGDAVDLTAGGVLRLAALVDAHGGAGGTGGGVSGRGNEVRAEAEINVNGDSGTIDLDTRRLGGSAVVGPVTVTGDLHAIGLGTGFGGDLTVEGCDVTVAAGATLRTSGASGGVNLVKTSGQLRVGGILAATPDGTNRLQYREATRPPSILATASITPAASLALVPSLLPCEAPVAAVCGNGAIEAGESCDDRNTAPCDGCSETCRIEACGNAVRECGEGCDDGDPIDGDGCDSNCMPTGCGNGVVTAGEQCDDGNRTSGDGCGSACVLEGPPGCGNRVIDPGEQCDDGNAVACDGCSPFCLGEACGNNVLECQEECDDGNTVAGDGCSPLCRPEGCGDGVVDDAAEECDDGNTLGGDCCSAACQREPSLDIDADGRTVVVTDMVYIARRLFGLSPVPPSYRLSDPTIPADDVVAARVDALGPGLDVDASGAVSVAADVVYIARRLSGLPPVPPSFRAQDPTIPPDSTIAATIAGLCGGR